MLHGGLALLGLFLPLLFPPMATGEAHLPVRVTFLTDCQKYSNWQTLAMIFSFKMSGQPGKLTRVMCCTPAATAQYPPMLLQEVETHVAPSFTIHPRTGDNYAAYNKPEAVIDWLEHVTPEEQYVLVLDSDQLLRRPFLVEQMHPEPGLAIGNKYSYMIGVANDLAMRHVPEVSPRNDTLAGPFGRRGDQVGGFFFIHRDDLKRMSHGWLKYTEDVRADKLAYKDSGDMYAIHPGDKPWISEMYGYSFGASTANVWHKWDTTSMIYPYGAYDHGSRGPTTMPKLMHYGLLFEINNWKFDKHWFYELDVTVCPPWDMTPGQKHQKVSGLFDHPPRMSEIQNKEYLPTYYRDLLVIESAATMNAGFCDYHLRHCPPSQQLYDECKKAWDIYKETADECRVVEAKMGCMDMHEKCTQWAKSGECEKNPEYMEATCLKACNKCPKGEPEESLKPVGSDLEKNLELMKKKLEEAAGGAGGETVAGGGEADKAVASSPPPAVSLPPPATSPPPPAVVATEPPNVEAVAVPKDPPPATEVVAQVAADSPPPPPPSKLRQRSNLSRKQLIVRCYRLDLVIDEVKACVDDAKDGYEYERKKARAMRADEAKGDDDAVFEEYKTKVDTQDGEDLALRASSPVVRPSIGGPLPSLAWHIGTWQALALGVVAAVALLVVLPRVLFRRRAKSGMRLD